MGGSPTMGGLLINGGLTPLQTMEHQSVLCLNVELKAIFKINKINRKSLGWSVIHLGYNKPLTTVCWKTPIFQSKQPTTK